MPYELRTPDFDDAEGIAKVQVHAFSQDPHWTRKWPNMTPDEIALGTFNRLPRSFIRGRQTGRHQIAVDTATGEIVGYAKWSFLDVDNASELWPEAQVAEAPEAQKAVYEERWKLGVDGNGRQKGSVRLVSTRPLAAECGRITNGQRFLGIILSFS